MRVLFACSSGPIHENAKVVAAALEQGGHQCSELILERAQFARSVSGAWEAGHVPSASKSRLDAIRTGLQGVQEAAKDGLPDVVVLGNDLGPIERVTLGLLAMRGVRTFLLQDGIIGSPDVSAFPLHRRLLAKTRVRFLKLPQYGIWGADALGAIGESSAAILTESCSSPVIVVGSPRMYEDRGQPSPDGPLMIAAQPGLPMGPIVSWAAQLAKSGLPTVVRLHPFQSKKGLGLDVFSSEPDLGADLSRSRGVVAFCSTVGLEAIATGLPLVRLSVSRSFDRIASGYPLYADPRVPAVSIGATDSRVLAALDQASKSQDQDMLAAHLAATGLNAARRVANEIERLVEWVA